MLANKTYDKTNTGTFSKNSRKRVGINPNSGKPYVDPDITGSINVNGDWFWFNAWQKQDQTGAVFYSASVKEKEQRQPNADDGATARHSANDDYRFANDNAQDDNSLDDKIPF